MEERKITFMAHRMRDGVSFQVENTKEAYIDAMKNPYIGGVEFDIRRTKDGIFVLMNYNTIENVTNLVDPSRNRIEDYTYEELCKMNFFANMVEIEKVISTNAEEFGEDAKQMLEYYQNLKVANVVAKIATLEEILVLPRNGKKIFIEIKTNYSKNEKQESITYAKDLIAILKKYNLSDFVIIGRDTNTLEAIKQEDSSLLCYPVIGYNDPEKATYGFDGASVALNHLNMNIPEVNKPVWEYILENGQEIAVWNLRTYKTFMEAEKIFDGTNTDFQPTGDFSGFIAEKYEKKFR